MAQQAHKFDHAVQMEVHECPSCGMPYAAPADFFQRINRGDAENHWYCPRGHSIAYVETNEQRLQKQLDAANRGLEFERRRAANAQHEARHEAARARGYKGALTRTKNRIKAGVCPCCNRQFQNLRRHMEHQHPGYAEEELGK